MVALCGYSGSGRLVCQLPADCNRVARYKDRLRTRPPAQAATPPALSFLATSLPASAWSSAFGGGGGGAPGKGCCGEGGDYQNTIYPRAPFALRPDLPMVMQILQYISVVFCPPVFSLSAFSVYELCCEKWNCFIIHIRKLSGPFAVL